MRIAITGASGFIGRNLVKKLIDKGESPELITRKPYYNEYKLKISNIDFSKDNQTFEGTLNKVECVIHLAATQNQVRNYSSSNIDSLFKVNCNATLNFARYAHKKGVKRFVFISSIKVNGETNDANTPFEENVKSSPQDPYALSKYKAELGLLKIAKETGLEVVIIRSPVVYGKDSKGNISKLIKYISWGIPLPLDEVFNKRSFISLENLIDFILLIINKEKSTAAANQVFLICDEKNISTTELIKILGKINNVKPRLFYCNRKILKLIFYLIGKSQIYERLFCNSIIKSNKAFKLLGWKPKFSIKDQFFDNEF